jgi:DNA-binding PucR family transcriptional regulator
MSRLDDAVRSVPAESSPADESVNEPDLDLETELPEAEGDQLDSGDEPDGEKGRTIENVRGELLRKLEKSNAELMRELRAMREESQRLKEQYGVPAAQPAHDQPKTLDQMSVQELEAMAPNVPDEQKEAFGQYLTERKVQARVDERLNKYEAESQRKTAEQRFNEQAMTRWPELRERSSEFYRVTDRILSEMGEVAASNPRAVLDAANEAGLELGLLPQTGVRRAAQPASRKQPVPGRKTKSGPGAEDKTPDLDEATIARLANAMPNKKFTKDQLKRIAERQQIYADDLPTRIRG